MKIDAIRTALAREIHFEDNMRGAIALSRLGWGLPTSEQIKGLTEAQRAVDVIRKTVLHSHRVQEIPDQYGRGKAVIFARHVSEADRRWDFEVEVNVVDDQAAIFDVRVVRPGDDVPDPDDAEAEPVEPRAPLTDAELLPHGMTACPCCGHATLGERAMYSICPVCFWEDDGQDTSDADANRGGPNRTSLTRARANYIAFAACDDKVREHVRPPTREEVQLRNFDAAGRES